MAAVVTSPEPTHRRSSLSLYDPDLGAPAFVWGIWALLLLSGLALCLRFGSRIPVNDDWEMVPALSGQQPITLAWLWSNYQDHRLALSRFVLLILYRLTGGDFRAGLIFSVLMMGILSFAMIRTARHLRGATSYADAFFPLALLHWEIWGSNYWSWQIVHFLAISLLSVFLLIIVHQGAQLTRAAAVVAGICLLLLPLCGASGVAFVPVLALWLGYVGLVRWRSTKPEARRDAGLLVGFALAGFVLVGLYFFGFGGPTPAPIKPGVREIVRMILQVANMTFGPSSMSFWPYSALLTPGLFLLSVAILVPVLRRAPQERGRVLGMLAVLGAVASLLLGLGWGRAGFGPARGLIPYYMILPLPALCCSYFIMELYAPPVLRRLVPMCLLLLMAFLFPLNVQAALHQFRATRAVNDNFTKDLLAGVPHSVLVERHWGNLHPSRERVDVGLRSMRDAGVGLFRRIKVDPAYQEVLLPVVPRTTHRMTWGGGAGRVSGSDSSATFALDKPRFVYAIRLKYSYKGTSSGAPFRMFWKRSGQNDFSEAERNAFVVLEQEPNYPPTGSQQRVVTLWVNTTIDQFQIRPDNKPSLFQISEIALLVPPAGA